MLMIKTQVFLPLTDSVMEGNFSDYVSCSSQQHFPILATPVY